MTEDLLHTQTLRQKVFQKIATEWQEKWATAENKRKHGKVFINFEHLKNKNSFFEALLDDINKVQKEKFGLENAAKKAISKDSVRRFLDENYPYGFEEKIKDAFAIYLGHESWEDFCAKQNPINNNVPMVINHHHVNVISILPNAGDWWEEKRIELEESPTKKRNWRFLGASMASLLLVLGIYRGFSHYQTHHIFTDNEKDKVKLTLIKRSNTYNPCIATFAYDFSELPIDSAVVYFPGARGKTDNNSIALKDKKGTFDFVFYKPNIQPIQLKYGNQLLKEINIIVQSHDWAGWYASGATPTWEFWESPVYQKKNYYQEGILFLHPDKIVDLVHRRDYYTHFTNVRDFGIMIPDCSLECRIKNSPNEYAISCFESIIGFIDTNNNTFSVGFTTKGCYYPTINKQPLKHDTNGDNGILYPYIFDDWHVVKLDFRGIIFRVYIDGKLFSENPYEAQWFNKLEKIRVTFKGSGKVDYVKVFDKNDKIVYQDDFNEVPVAKIREY